MTVTAVAADVDITALAKAVDDLRAARELIRDLQAQEKAAAAAIREAIGEGSVGLVAGRPVVRLDRRVTTSVDKARVAALLAPDVFASVLRHTPSTVLRLL